MSGHHTLEFCSDLITAMTLRNAPSEDLESAIRYSMAVIDAKKKNVNLEKAFSEYGVKTLCERYLFNNLRRKYNVNV